MNATDTLVEVLRSEGLRVLATLARTIGDLAVAEDALSEATITALDAWPKTGIPDKTTITVSGGKGGDVLLVDGPYAEAKEVLGGYFLLEAADLDEAIAWAAQIPAAWRGKIELRPIAPVHA